MKKHQITTTLYDCNDDETEITKEGADSIDMCDNFGKTLWEYETLSIQLSNDLKSNAPTSWKLEDWKSSLEKDMNVSYFKNK